MAANPSGLSPAQIEKLEAHAELFSVTGPLGEPTRSLPKEGFQGAGMTTQHKVLVLADRLESLRDCSPASPEAATELRAQHALIVQMRETVEACLSALVRIRESGGKSTSAEILCERDLAAADKYLGEQG